MALENEVDANFFNLIHQMVGSSELDESERRGARRRPFSSQQRIAVRRELAIPDESEFFDVRCHDLTRGGFSFFRPTRPDFDSLVAEFGTPPEVIYVAARVSHCCNVLLHSSGLVERLEEGTAQAGVDESNGQAATPLVLVGCLFTERLHR